MWCGSHFLARTIAFPYLPVSFGQAHTSISTSWYYREQNSSSNSEESSLACFQKQAQKVVDMKGGEKEDLFKRATVNRGNYRRSTKEHHQQLFNSGMLLLSLELPLNHFQSGNLLNRLNQWCYCLLPVSNTASSGSNNSAVFQTHDTFGVWWKLELIGFLFDNNHPITT